MQYLLTQDEYKELVDCSKKITAREEKKLQEFCTFVADNLILDSGWKKGETWGCILSEEDEWYCDDCPAREVCPYEFKSWSK